jgi:hypothetical protein
VSAFFVALLASIGLSTWAYTKLQNKTGYGNGKNALSGTAVVFVISFVVIFTIMHMVMGHSA